MKSTGSLDDPLAPPHFDQLPLLWKRANCSSAIALAPYRCFALFPSACRMLPVTGWLPSFDKAGETSEQCIPRKKVFVKAGG